MAEKEVKNCQNCKQEFTIESVDFDFYKKMQVPPPTFCPDCRLMRRLTWRNERNLYKRKCDAPGHGESIITMYPPELAIPVYDTKYWWSDEWDPMQYGREYDFSRPFFEQWKELLNSVPLISLINISDVQSDYCNFTYESKNCYLNFASDMNEDTAYLYHSIENKDCFDMLGSRKNEHCYQLVDSEACYESDHLILSEGCINSKYCYDCRNSQDCIGCVGLRNAKHSIFNQQFSPEEYKEKVKELRLDTKTGRAIVEKRFRELLLTRPRKFSNSRRAVNSTGDYLNGVKDCKDCFDVEGPAENSRFLVYGVTEMRDLYDAYAVGLVESSYDIMDTGLKVHNVAFCGNVWESYDTQYCYFVRNSPHCFGSVGIRNKQYCILNKQYSKEEYEAILPKIKEHMMAMPYVDSHKKEYRYGEFFPMEMSFFAYNETIAQEYFPLDKEEAVKRGYIWREAKDKSNTFTMKFSQIPTSIQEVDQGILQELIQCRHEGVCNHQCTKVFRLIAPELQLLKKLGVPIPELCVNCRHYERLGERNKFKLCSRQCVCDGKVFRNSKEHTSHVGGRCLNKFETTYTPDRPEIVYCEQCYNAEIV